LPLLRPHRMLRAKGKVGGVPGTLPGLQGLAHPSARRRPGRVRIQSDAFVTGLIDKRKTSDGSVSFDLWKWLETGKNQIADSALVSALNEEKRHDETDGISRKEGMVGATRIELVTPTMST
jgi:hypothetical protein